MKRGRAKWPSWAKCRSAIIMAASIPRRCSCCWPAPISSAPATLQPSARSGPISWRRLRWIETYGDRDGDGFVEYGRKTEEGLANQGWKDSHDSIFHADGSLARGPIALAEVQSYVYGAWRAAALLARALGHHAPCRGLATQADVLRRRFDEVFFDEEMAFYVLALDGEKKPCRVRASNAGHALFTGIAFKERAGAVVAALMERTFFSGWGVRTVASTEPRYNPMSYHNGSVWPHDNALIAAGFARYGFAQEAARIFDGLFDAATYIDLRRLPELFCGFPRRATRGRLSIPWPARRRPGRRRRRSSCCNPASA